MDLRTILAHAKQLDDNGRFKEADAVELKLRHILAQQYNGNAVDSTLFGVGHLINEFGHGVGNVATSIGHGIEGVAGAIGNDVEGAYRSFANGITGQPSATYVPEQNASAAPDANVAAIITRVPEWVKEQPGGTATADALLTHLLSSGVASQDASSVINLAVKQGLVTS